MTECIQTSFEFSSELRQQVVARFDGGTITTEAGALLLHKVEQKTGILRQFARCFLDHRDPERTEHSVAELVRQRIYALALGYEDLNDHDQLRADPLLGMLSGKADVEGRQRRRKQDRGKAGAGKSTLNRLELTPADASRKARYKKIVMDTAAVDDLLVDLYIQRQKRAPRRIVLDLDATDDPLHGHQEGRFFHGYYDQYCYLPLYIFLGEHLLCVRLRRSNIDASEGALEEVKRIVARLRRVWPEAEIVLRADSGFCRDEMMSWCEDNRVGYAFGLARNSRLEKRIRKALRKAQQHAETGKPARLFVELRYRTRQSWSRRRRVVAKAEYTDKGENPRFVVTSLGVGQIDGRSLYEDFYCARGEMENRIKGAAIGSVCGPDLDSAAPFQSDPAVLIQHHLLPAAGVAGVGAGGHSNSQSAVRHHPAAAAQDRCSGAGDGAQDLDFDGVGPSGEGAVCRCL
ncbi:MAG TPA: IS1380 family transposase [Bryobacteraceae bacterium]|nr:IS1380 family transposase [Bryobacteraceae bacterium]